MMGLKHVLTLACAVCTCYTYAQNVGIGEPNPASKLTVKGNLSIGTGYSNTEAPANGIIVQGTAGFGTSNPDASAIIDMGATDKGLLIPRLTTAQKTAINSPAIGLLVFDTDENGFYYYDGSAWTAMAIGGGTGGVTGPTGRGYESVTSTSAVTIGTGAKTFTVNETGAYAVGSRVRASATVDPAEKYMEGSITAISGQSITIDVDAKKGSGSQSSWNFSIAGIKGAKGDDGEQGATGATGPQGPAGATGATGPQGVAGANGAQGATGPTGPQGAAGANGSNGTNGATWLTGSSAPTGGQGSINDFYLRSSNGTYYKKTGGSTWTSQGSLIGPAGPAGAQGATGATGPQGPAGSSNGWALTGNSASGSDFIGTTNSQEFRIRTNNTQRMVIDESGNVGIGHSDPGTGLWVKYSYANKNVITVQNTESNGYSSIDFFNQSGTMSATVGFGNSNTGFFSNKAYMNSYGNDYVFTTNSSDYNLFIKGSNGSIGIGTSSPSYKLDVSGTGRFTGALKVGAYTLPATDGSNGQVLATNGSGTLSWTTVSGGGGGNYINNGTGQQASANFNISGNGSMGGNLSAGGSASIGGSASVGGALSVGGNASVAGTLTVGGYSLPSSAGAEGAVLRSTGSGTEWVSGAAATQLKGNTDYDAGTTKHTISSSSWTTLSGLSNTINLTGSAKLVINTQGGIQTTSSNSSGYSVIDIAIYVDGNQMLTTSGGGYQRLYAQNDSGYKAAVEFWSTMGVITLSSGSHTIEVKAKKISGSDAWVSGENGEVLQGSLFTQILY